MNTELCRAKTMRTFFIAPLRRDPAIKELTFDPSYSLSQRLIRLGWKVI
jgi:hypothetical protein